MRRKPTYIIDSVDVGAGLISQVLERECSSCLSFVSMPQEVAFAEACRERLNVRKPLASADA